MIFWNYKIEKSKNVYLLWYKKNIFSRKVLVSTSYKFDGIYDCFDAHRNFNNIKNVRLKIYNYVK